MMDRSDQMAILAFSVDAFPLGVGPVLGDIPV